MGTLVDAAPGRRDGLGLLRRVQPRRRWAAFWLQWAGLSPFGRLAMRLAGLGAGPYKARCFLARLGPRGYVAPTARLSHRALRLGAHVFIGDRVVIYQADPGAGPVELGDRVHLYQDIVVEVGQGGSVSIGADTHIQPRCQLAAFVSPIRIGAGVQIAPGCALYPYNHGFAADRPIGEQPLTSRGGIVIEDDAWLGVGATVLDGVRIGRSAVVGAGAVVTRDVPAGAIVTGLPARVTGVRR